MTDVRSRSNPRLRRWQRLLRDARQRRIERRALIEGPHLLASYLEHGGVPLEVIVGESARRRAEVATLVRRTGRTPVVLADALFSLVADTGSPSGIAAEIALPEPASPSDAAPVCLFLDGIQDAGNVGAILRSAAAFGIGDVVLSRGCADAWSPRVLRAAMGGHFALRIAHTERLDDALAHFAGTVVCTAPRGGTPLGAVDLRGRVGWIFGAEGRGVGAALAARADVTATIPMPGAAESLNVAAAAAICFYERARQLNTPDARS